MKCSARANSANFILSFILLGCLSSCSRFFGLELTTASLSYNGATTVAMNSVAREFVRDMGGLAEPRFLHTATPLPDGRILILGGANITSTNSIEIFDPISKTSVLQSTTLGSPRLSHTSTLLPDGRIFILGGGVDLVNPEPSIEVYNTLTHSVEGVFSSLNTPRFGHTATLLQDGTILVTGGAEGYGIGALNSMEIYDPSSMTSVTLTETLKLPRYGAAASLLPDGKVIIAGGSDALTGYHDTLEIYDPDTQTTSLLPTPLSIERWSPSIVTLPDGKVLVVGGYGNGFHDSMEIYDPADGSVTLLSNTVSTPKIGLTTTIMPDGSIYFIGGSGDGMNGKKIIEVYDYATEISRSVSSGLMKSAVAHTSTLLPDGKILVAGGFNRTFTQVIKSLEILDPSDGSSSLLPGTLTIERGFHTATLLQIGKVLIVGGSADGSTYLDSMELYDPLTQTSSAISSTLNIARGTGTATLLSDGKVLIAGGVTDGGTILSSLEIYNPLDQSVTLLPITLLAPRQGHTATLLGDGRVLFAGGNGLASMEIYNHEEGTITPIATQMSPGGRIFFDAHLLQNGTVAFIGGMNTPDSIEYFDPQTEVMTVDPTPLEISYYAGSSILLPNGKILLTGGFNTPQNVSFFTPIQTFGTTPLSLSGGTPPYHFEVLSGNGMILGSTLSSSTTGPVTVKGTDSKGESQTFSIVFYLPSAP